MPKHTPPGNRLLAGLPKNDYERLLPQLPVVPLRLKHVLSRPRVPLDYAYFPNRGLTSMVLLMEDGRTIEVATIGREGMVGLPVFLGTGTAPAQFIVKLAGEARRMPADVLREETSRDSPLRRLLLLYQGAFLSQLVQSIACNGLHTVLQRCCRWLLLAHDGAQADAFPLTHEFLATMLGVRRSSITGVLQVLQDEGLIRYSRGKILALNLKGLEGAGCECYRRVQEEFDRLLPTSAK